LETIAGTPGALALQPVADAVDRLVDLVRTGDFDWRWAPALVRVRPEALELLLESLRHGGMPGARNAAISIADMTTGIDVDAKLAVLATALGRHHDVGSAPRTRSRPTTTPRPRHARP
jgi:hypothetical protein